MSLLDLESGVWVTHHTDNWSVDKHSTRCSVALRLTRLLGRPLRVVAHIYVRNTPTLEGTSPLQSKPHPSLFSWEQDDLFTSGVTHVAVNLLNNITSVTCDAARPAHRSVGPSLSLERGIRSS